MILIFYILIFITINGDHEAYSPHRTSEQTLNNRPRVKIVLPKEGTILNKNSSIRYLVTVSDVEDGSTEYGEIKPEEVHIELSCWPSVQEAIEYKKRIDGITEDPPGLLLLKRSGCFNCHQDKTRFMGPSFQDISKRYPSKINNIRSLATNIIHGSSGIWGEMQMPPNPNLTEEEVMQAVEYILIQGGNENSSLYSGNEGAIKPITPDSDTTCVYVLSTYYTDKGKPGDPGSALIGHHSILLN